MSAVEDKMVKLYAFRILSGDLDLDDIPIPYKQRVKEHFYVMSVAMRSAYNDRQP